MLREFTPNFGLEGLEGFTLLKDSNFVYLLHKRDTKVIAMFTHNIHPRDVMRECGRYLKKQRRAGLL